MLQLIYSILMEGKDTQTDHSNHHHHHDRNRRRKETSSWILVMKTHSNHQHQHDSLDHQEKVVFGDKRIKDRVHALS